MTASNTIEAMLVFLSDRCNHASTYDGAGFNKIDASFANSMADQVRAGRRLSHAQKAAAHKLLQKYASQLSSGGFDIKAIPSPSAEPTGIEARSPGRCFVCQQPIQIGALIKFMNDGTKRRYHADCQPDEQQISRADQLRQQATVESFEDVRVPEQESHLAAIRDEQPRYGADEYQRLYDPENLPVPVEVTTRTGHDVAWLLGPEGPIASALPGYEKRQEQIDCAMVIEQTLAQKRHSVIEAGTGTGKSFMYLMAAYNSGLRATVSTADKSLQGQISGKDAPFVQEIFPDYTFAVMKGRTNYLCKLKHAKLDEEISGGLFGIEGEGWKDSASIEAWPVVKQWAAETDHGDIETVEGITPELRERLTTDSEGCVGRKCPFFQECWVEVAKHRAERADVVIVNHALLLRDRRIRLETGHNIIPTTDVIVLDEAHHLEDQATDAWADELTRFGWVQIGGRVDSLARNHKKLDDAQKPVAEQFGVLVDEIEKAITDACQAIAERFQAGTDGRKPSHLMCGGFHVEGDAIRAATNKLSDMMKQNVPTWLEDDKERTLWKKTERSVWNAGRKWQRALHAPDETDGYVRYAELRQGRATEYVIVNVKPIEVAEILRDALFMPRLAEVAETADIDDEWDEEPAMELERPTVVCTSATIAVGSNMAAWKARVGMDDGAEMIVDSPFDYKRNAIIYIPNPELGFDPTGKYGNTEAARIYQQQIAKEMLDLCEASQGRAFLLFTSRRMMDFVYNEISAALAFMDLQVLKQGMNGISRPKLVEMFKERPSVLFGVASFWEGVDVQGDALSLVAIDKMPFTPPDDPIWSERERVIKDRGGNPFMELQVPFATIKLKQGAGRLIRSKTDRGVIAILDARLRTKRYGPLVINSLPKAHRSETHEHIAALFNQSR